MTDLNEKNQLEKKVKNILKFYEIGNFEEVALRTKHLIKKYPDVLELRNLLALAYKELNQSSEAIKLLEEARRIEPNNIHFLNNLGMIHSNLNNFELAKKYLNRALELKPDFFQSGNNLANLLLKINKTKEAIVILNSFLNKENSNNYLLNFTLGNAHQQAGNFDNAKSYFEKCLEINPNRCDSDKAISLMTDYKNDKSNHLLKMEKKINNKLSKTDLMLLNFSLGKAYEDIKNYEKSFYYLKNANKLQNEFFNHNPLFEKKIFEKIKLIFKNKFNTDNKNYISDKKVIFIVGMPRSGTTLIEQILSTNSKVYGAGELPFIGNFADDLFFNPKGELNYDSLEKVEEKIFENLNKNYFEKISSYNIAENIIIDKAPFNFKWIGLILKIIPNCKIIHCERDGMDICWSHYKNFFTSIKMDYAYSFENIANYYKLYLDIMSFWRKKFSKEIHNINYEKLIENPENEIKKLINYCEIDWNKNYLNFHKNTKSVQTASLAQVRSPLYKSSIKKWENFGEELKKLEKLINY